MLMMVVIRSVFWCKCCDIVLCVIKYEWAVLFSLSDQPTTQSSIIWLCFVFMILWGQNIVWHFLSVNDILVRKSLYCILSMDYYAQLLYVLLLMCYSITVSPVSLTLERKSHFLFPTINVALPSFRNPREARADQQESYWSHIFP